MAIVDLQRRIAEVGRIRIGQQVPMGSGKTRPAKLETFRLTSPDQRRIIEAAKLYGGTPQEWQAPAGKQWECITDVDVLPVVVPPGDIAFSQFYELWSAGGCKRRCDGTWESLSDQPCMCDPSNRECDIHTRLSVMLRDLSGLGVWRLDTQGYYAAVELQGAVEIVRMAAGAGHMLPATLRLEQRMTKRQGETVRRFAVPVLDLDVTPAQLLRGRAAFDQLDAGTIAIEPPHEESQQRASLTPVPETVPEEPAPSIAEQAVAPKPRKPRKNAAQRVPATGLEPRTAAEARENLEAAGVVTTVVAEQKVDLDDEPPSDEAQLSLTEPPDDDDSEPPITADQLKKMLILFRERGFGDEDRDARIDLTRSIIGRQIDSAKELSCAEASLVIDNLQS